MDAASVEPSKASSAAAWLGLLKLRLNALVLAAVGGGYWVGARPDPALDVLIETLVGAFLAAVGGSALNQLFESEFDAKMVRTQGRALPIGALTHKQVAAFGVGASSLGVGILFGAVGPAPGLVSAAIVASYLFLYTPLKRRSSLNTVVGAVPGALPPVLGWSAATGGFEAEAWALFGILFCWQIPHFLAIATLHDADYARGGYRMLPGEDPNLRATARQTLLWFAALLPTSLMPTRMGIAGVPYFYAALVLGIGFGAACVFFAVKRTRASARVLFGASIAYLALLWAALTLLPA